MEKKAEKRSSTGYLLSVFAKLGVVLLSFLMHNLLGLSLDMKNLFKRSYDSEVCSADEHSNEAESLFLKDKEQRGKRKRESGIEDERVLASTGSSEEEASKKEAKKKKTQKDIKASLEPLDGEKYDECKLHHTVFVRNLPVKTKKKHLIREFSQFGEVQSVGLRSVPLVETKMPRKNAVMTKKKNEAIGSCHAYIVFNHEQSANAALSHNMTEFGGNQIRVDRAQPPSKKLRGENHL